MTTRDRLETAASLLLGFVIMFVVVAVCVLTVPHVFAWCETLWLPVAIGLGVCYMVLFVMAFGHTLMFIYGVLEGWR